MECRRCTIALRSVYSSVEVFDLNNGCWEQCTTHEPFKESMIMAYILSGVKVSKTTVDL